MSQLLILIYNYIDKGVQTCGLDFHFDIPDEDEKRREQTTPMITMMKTLFRTRKRPQQTDMERVQIVQFYI